MTDEEIEKISDEEIQSICYGLNLASLVGGSDFVQTLIPKKDILKLLRYINKQEKAIDRMAEKIKEDTEWFYGEFDNKSKEEIKEYFMEEKE